LGGGKWYEFRFFFDNNALKSGLKAEWKKAIFVKMKGVKFQFFDHFSPTSDSVIIFSNYQACLPSIFRLISAEIFLLQTLGNSKSFSCQKLYEIVIILPLPFANEAVEKRT
jgi:hypothetical protein